MKADKLSGGECCLHSGGVSTCAKSISTSLQCVYVPCTGRPAVVGSKKGKKPSKEVALKLAEEKQQKLADAAARQDKVG